MSEYKETREYPYHHVAVSDKSKTPRTDEYQRTRPSLMFTDDLAFMLELERELAAAQAKYDELIYQVGTKWPNETRHETALRYIKRYENSLGDLSAKADDALAAKVK